MSVKTGKNKTILQKELYSFCCEDVNTKQDWRWEFQGAIVYHLRNISLEKLLRETTHTAFAVSCKHNYQECPDSLNIWIWPAFLLGMKKKVPFAGVLTALGGAQMRGRRLQAGCCLCLAAAASPPLQWADDASAVLFFLSPLDFSCVWAQWKLQGQAQPKQSRGKPKTTYLFPVGLLGGALICARLPFAPRNCPCEAGFDFPVPLCLPLPVLNQKQCRQ